MPNFILGWATGGTLAEGTGQLATVGTLLLDQSQLTSGVDLVSAISSTGQVYFASDSTLEVFTGDTLYNWTFDTLDFETRSVETLTIYIRLLDNTDNGVGEVLTFSVTNVQEAPDGLVLSGGSIAENSAIGTVVATLNGHDPEGGALTYALVSGTGFSVVGNHLQVSGPLNHEATASANLVFSVTDAQNNSTQFSRTIAITDVNEAPVILPFANVTTSSITQDAAAGRQVARVTVSDPDLGDSAALSLTGRDAGLFVLDGGRVRLAQGAVLDHNAAPSLSFNVHVVDGGGLASDQAFTVQVETAASQAVSLQALLGAGNGTAIGLTVTLGDEEPVLRLGGSSVLLSAHSTLLTGDGELGFGAHSALATQERLFLGLAGRAAMGDERMGVNDEVGSHGATATDLAQTLLHSGEFTAYIRSHSAAQDVDGLSNGEFVEILYTRLLGRASEPGAQAAWAAGLDAHSLSRAEAATLFANSDEAKAHYQSQTQALWAVDLQAYQVRDLYDVALNREPDAAGLAHWRDALEHGATLHQVAEAIVGSSEFQAHTNGLSTSQLVEMFYLDGLERAPESAGLAYWTALLDSHQASVADVLLGFALSIEQDSQLASYRNGTDIFI